MVRERCSAKCSRPWTILEKPWCLSRVRAVLGRTARVWATGAVRTRQASSTKVVWRPPVQAVLDPPVTPTEGEQPFSIALLARETGNGVDGLPAFLPSQHPPPMDTAHLVDPRPVQV